MKNKWSSKNVRGIQQWLIGRWPDLFASRPDQMPLSLSIHKEILKYRAENPRLSGRLLREALKRHVTSHGYLYGMQKNSHRVDLDGNKVESVSAVHREWARNTLRAKQKLAQKVRKEKMSEGRVKPARKSQRVAALARPKSECSNTDTTAGKAGPVIRYKTPRRKIVKREVNLAN